MNTAGLKNHHESEIQLYKLTKCKNRSRPSWVRSDLEMKTVKRFDLWHEIDENRKRPTVGGGGNTEAKIPAEADGDDVRWNSPVDPNSSEVNLEEDGELAFFWLSIDGSWIGIEIEIDFCFL